MHRTEFKGTRIALGMTQGEAARLMQVEVQTVHRWETGKAAIPKAATVLMTGMLLQQLGLPVKVLELCKNFV